MRSDWTVCTSFSPSASQRSIARASSPASLARSLDRRAPPPASSTAGSGRTTRARLRGEVELGVSHARRSARRCASELARRPRRSTFSVVSSTGLTMKMPTAARIATVVTILMIGLMTVPAPSIAGATLIATLRTGLRVAQLRHGRATARTAQYPRQPMAKDTEKLIRQLSLISFLMANRRPVSALEIKREVEGYSSMNEDAFARRFYADRAELESLGISLQVEKPAEGFFEAELYALPPENYYLPAIEFSDSELAALRTALGLLDGEFAYAEPLRLALQQVSWGRPSPLTEEDEAPIDVKLSTAGGGRELSQRLAKIETAISRRKTIEFSYYSLQRDEVSDRKVNPYHLVFRDGQFYLIGYSHERDEVRVFRLSRIRGKVSYATKAEHDFQRARGLRPPRLRQRAPTGRWARSRARAAVFLRERIAWLVERDFGRHGEFRKPTKADGVQGRGLGLRDRVRVRAPADLVGAELARERPPARRRRSSPSEADERLALLRDRHRARVRRSPRPSAARSPRATARGRAARTAARSR